MMRIVIAGFALLLSGCGRFNSILMEPKITAEQWCGGMPCVEMFSTGVVFDQPSSSLLVYLLGLMWVWVALRFWHSREEQESKLWWSIAMVLGGIAAISAGTSYQAFGYELKCAGRELCLWTSWWEIAYMVLQVGSFNAMLVAVAYSCSVGRLRHGLTIYAGINCIAHFVVTLVGIYTVSKFLLSFELLVLFIMPGMLAAFVINAWRYIKYQQQLDLVLLGGWLLLTVANVCYYAYLYLGYSQQLWQRGIWFNENDVLHVLVAVWVIYVGRVLVGRVRDYQEVAANLS